MDCDRAIGLRSAHIPVFSIADLQVRKGGLLQLSPYKDAYLSGWEGWLASAVALQGSPLQIETLYFEVTLTQQRGQATLPDLTIGNGDP
jgi:hypothetical protein